MSHHKITMLCFHINKGSILGEVANGEKEWSKPINLSKEFKIKSRDSLSIIQELEEKHGFELVCHWPMQFNPGVFGDQFILRKKE